MKKFRYIPNVTKSSKENYQLPITLYLNVNEQECPGLCIKVMYIETMNLCLPYIATSTRTGWKPFMIPGGLFPESPTDKRYNTMRWFRCKLPRVIARQYYYAELLQIPGFNHIPPIESGSVIRELEEKIYDRLCTIGPLELACVYHKNSVKV